MQLKNLLVQQKPREKSGARSSNRFDFQQDWVICKLIELYKTQTDFLVLLDYHDDVVVLNGEENPNEMSFYQLKTKHPGNWTLKGLLSRKQGKNGKLPSIIGKLYSCRLSFPNHTLSLNFVSNASFNVKLYKMDESGIDKKEICFNEISLNDMAIVINQLKEEHSLKEEPDFIDFTFLQVTDLNINDREAYVKGKLSEFLEELNPEGKFRIGLIYKTIFDEVKRKNNYEYDIDKFEDLLNHKSIAKNNFDNMLSNFDVDNRCEKMWKYTETQLSTESIPINDILDLSLAWNKYEIEKMDLTNSYLLSIKEVIKKIVNPYRVEKKIFKLNADLIEPSYIEFKQQQLDCIYDEFYIKSIILMEFYGI